jgi:hypothetical protein
MRTKIIARLVLAVGVALALPPLLFALAMPAAQGCEYWVAPPPAGSNANPGTFAQPWATLDYASANVPDNNCTVWFKDGTYNGTHSLYERFNTSVTFKAVNPYKAILQYSGTVVKLFGARNIIFEGFEVRHTGPGAGALVMQVQQDGVNGAENIVIRNNIFHDSYNNDLLKINNGARFITVEHNLFYNQSGSDEHIDVNSVTDVLIRDNVFFNDFGGSGRMNNNDTSSFIVIKDSNAGDDGQIGSLRITVRRNVFLNWQGSSGSNFVLVGEDGQPYFEGQDIRVENNLMMGNAPNNMRAAFGVKGGKNITFTNNTVVGDLPALAYALRINREGSNPVNQNIVFRNNIWADPTGTMGAEAGGGTNEFSDGDPSESTNLILDNNLYWNGGAAIPPGDLVSPLIHDARRTVANPLLNFNHASVVLPRWNGSAFASGNATIRQEFERLVNLYATIPTNSPAIGEADPAFAPADDILGRSRGAAPDLGAFERTWSLAGSSGATSIWLTWGDPQEPGAASLAITYTTGTTSLAVGGIPTTTRAYTLTGLSSYTLYTVTLTARNAGNAILAETNPIVLLTTNLHTYLPIILKT